MLHGSGRRLGSSARPARSSKDDLALSVDAQSRALGTYGFATSQSDLNGWQITELDAVVGEYGVDFVGDDCDQGLQEGRCRMSVSFLVE